MAYFAELQDFDMIITDSEISEEYRSIIGELGIKLVVV
jgi:DeoR/GlpR family transcriptional regulator of sugar metabolism